MNNDEAKFILNAYRPNGADASGPAFEEALRQAERDPALHAWLAREQAHDAAVSAKLAEIQPPPGLRDTILAGGRASRRRRMYGWRVWGGIAAALVIVAGAGLWWSQRPSLPPELLQLALLDVAEPTPHSGHGREQDSFSAQLATPGTKLRQAMAIDFGRLRNSGCRTLNLTGATVLEVCFQRGGTWLHCYVVRRAELPPSDRLNSPVFAASGSFSAVGWAHGDYQFVVAGPVNRETLAALL